MWNNIIELDDADFERCVEITNQFQQCAEKNKYQVKYDQPINLTFEHTLQGVLGEQCVAHYFEHEYKYMGYDKNAHDILGYEVRTTYYFNGSLITHANDKPGIYILVTFDKNEMLGTLQGWSTLKRCNERKQNWRTEWRYPCFAMPQNQLWPIDLLPATRELIEHKKAAA